MTTYIKGFSTITPLGNSWRTQFPDTKPVVENGFLKASEPDYKKYVNPMTLRRMSRVVKMGIYAAKSCLEDAGVEMPDAIITGTGLGCIEDTEKFLVTMIKNDEKFLNPTPFIQSTHNTVSSQISLFLKCHAYNMTYSHRGLSFETALLDSMSLLAEGNAQNILTGGIDELTQHSYRLQKRLGMWKNEAAAAQDTCLLKSPTRGSLAGEGAAFLCLTNEPGTVQLPSIAALKFWTGSDNNNDIAKTAYNFLENNNCAPDAIDLLLLGYSGDRKTDTVYDRLSQNAFPASSTAYYKHLCGDYQTASSFAIALGAHILKSQSIPDIMRIKIKDKKPLKHILLYNHFLNKEHALILLRNDAV